MDSSLNEEIDEGRSLLNQAKPGLFNVIAKALHRTVTQFVPPRCP